MNDIDKRDARLGELLDRSVRAIEPAEDVELAMARGERRRTIRRVAMVVYVTAFVAVVAVAAVVVQSDDSTEPVTGETTSSAPTVIHYRDDAHGFEMTYPADWFRAEQNLMPELTTPVEILSLATYPLEHRARDLAFDARLPGIAARVGVDGIFITLQESHDSPGFPDDRPATFDPAVTGECSKGNCLGIPMSDENCPDGYACPEGGYHAWWIPFRDQERAFYAFVAMGDGAFDDLGRYQLPWQILDSLRFDQAAAGRVFALCPSIVGAVSVGEDAEQTAEATVTDFLEASRTGDHATFEQLSDPVAGANGVDVEGLAGGPTASQAAADDPTVVDGCDQNVADLTWRVTVDDGTDSASLDVSLYLIRRSDGWKVWGSY
jgi:hypothetical protein